VPRRIDLRRRPATYSGRQIRIRMWHMANVVGERFQITIDKKVREELGVQPGDQAVEFVEDGRR